MRQENWVDDTLWEFGRPGFWFIHVMGTSLLFFLGFHYTMRRNPVSAILYRMLRSILRQ